MIGPYILVMVTGLFMHESGLYTLEANATTEPQILYNARNLGPRP